MVGQRVFIKICNNYREDVHMAFKIGKKEEFLYSSPQEMYQDNKLRKIMGPLDYQSDMLNLYNKNIGKKTVALELPTGSGKTLVGLLIGEYRRRKNKEKILFLFFEIKS